jgi:hypothetical protein
MTKTQKYYVIFFYADKQPNYEWSFSNDIDKAMKYKTFKNADKQFEQANTCRYKNIDMNKSSIYEIEEVTTTIITSIKTSKQGTKRED